MQITKVIIVQDIRMVHPRSRVIKLLNHKELTGLVEETTLVVKLIMFQVHMMDNQRDKAFCNHHKMLMVIFQNGKEPSKKRETMTKSTNRRTNTKSQQETDHKRQSL